MFEFLTILVILAVFGGVFYFMYQKDKKDRDRVDLILKTFDNTIGSFLSSTESTNNKFYEMSSRIETEHFKQLEKSMDKQYVMLATQNDKFINLLKEKKEKQEVENRITKLDIIQQEENPIEKQEEVINPLEELNPTDFMNIKNVQFEGEETIYPISPE